MENKSEVRWLVQGRLKTNATIDGAEDCWIDRSDVSYSGWFYGGVSDEPSEQLTRDVERAREEAPHMDFRVVQQIRTFRSKVLDI